MVTGSWEDKCEFYKKVLKSNYNNDNDMKYYWNDVNEDYDYLLGST